MSFALSPKVNPPTAFMAKLSELTDRFDPELVLFRRKTHAFKFPVRRLLELFAEPPQYGAGERGLERESSEQPRYVRITDIDEYGILSDELGATAATVDPRYILRDYDLLIARSGNTVGKAYLHKQALYTYTCFYAGYLIRFRFQQYDIRPEYVFTLTQLPYYKAWVRAVKRAAGQPNINAQEYSNLQIPVPPLPIQQKVVSKLHAAYEIKRHHESEAKRQLNSIDIVLLTELGIKPTIGSPNTIENRIFHKRFHELMGQRWDPIFHCGDVFHFVRDAKCALPKLNELITMFQTGFAAGRNAQGEEENGIIQIRPTNISDDRELVFNRNIYIDASELKRRKVDILKRGEVLFNNTNSQEQVGKTAYYGLEGDCFCSNHITRIATKEKLLNPLYLYFILNLYQRREVFFKLCTNWNNQSGVGVDVLKKIPIPLPNLKRQLEIIQQLEKIRTDAHELRRKADLELENAKSAIETLILDKGRLS